MEPKLRSSHSVGQNLKALRKKNKLSQERLSLALQLKGCHISRRVYAKYESGELNIRISVLLALKDYYICTWDDFFAGL